MKYFETRFGISTDELRILNEYHRISVEKMRLPLRILRGRYFKLNLSYLFDSTVVGETLAVQTLAVFFELKTTLKRPQIACI